MNQKSLIAVLGVVIVVLIGTTVYFATINNTSQPVVQSQPVTTPQSATSAVVPAGWKTYVSKPFNVSISLPNDWKLVSVNDGSLTEPNSDLFNGDLKYGFLTGVSSPDKKEGITFVNGPLDLTTGTTEELSLNSKCTSNFTEINNQKVKEINCPDRTGNTIPGHYNYEFVDKKLVIIVDNKSAMTDKVISLIKFN